MLPACGRPDKPGAKVMATICRLEIGDTAGWKPALRQTGPIFSIARLGLLDWSRSHLTAFSGTARHHAMKHTPLWDWGATQADVTTACHELPFHFFGFPESEQREMSQFLLVHRPVRDRHS